MGQGDSARDFDPSESMENVGILCVFPIFHTARLGQKISRSPPLPLCGVALTEKSCNTKGSGNRGFKLSLLLPELLCFQLECAILTFPTLNPLNYPKYDALKSAIRGLLDKIMLDKSRASMTSLNFPVWIFLNPATRSPVQILARMTGYRFSRS